MLAMLAPSASTARLTVHWVANALAVDEAKNFSAIKALVGVSPESLFGTSDAPQEWVALWCLQELATFAVVDEGDAAPVPVPAGMLRVEAAHSCEDLLVELTGQISDGAGKSPTGKQALTRFQRICTDGTHSIVLCKPVTGRTHQIRVHLKHTGYPIANDELYLSGNFCPRSTKGTSAASTATAPSDSDSCTADHGSKDAEADEEFDIDPMCTNCPNLAPVGYDGDEEGLWLHCVRYTGPNWSYECPYPDWAFLDSVSTKKMRS